MSQRAPHEDTRSHGHAPSLTFPAPQTGRIRVAGGELEYDLVRPETSGGNPPLVFLHGWTLDRRMWSEQTGAFPDRAVVALDRRGCGDSSAPGDLGAEAADVVAVLDQLGFGKAVLVGMSQAGQVAADVALAHPSRLAGLVFHGARLGPLAMDQSPDIPLAEYRDLVLSGDLDAMKVRWRAHPLMRPVDPLHQAAMDAMLDRYDGSDLTANVTPRPATNLEQLARLRIPMLMIAGDRDTPLRREVARRLADSLPDASAVEIKAAGHMCNLCAPGAYNAALRSFLDRLPAAR